MGMAGKLAVCSRGFLGVITHDKRQTITYKWDDACVLVHNGPSCKCEKGEAYVGIHLSAEKVGKFWCSRDPQILGDAVEVAKAYQRLQECAAGYPPTNA